MAQNNPSQGIPVTDNVAHKITRVEELAYELKIGQVMTRDTRTFTPSMQMRDVSDLFSKARISGAPVMENDRLVGIISMEDLIQALLIGDAKGEIRKYMTLNVTTVHSNDPVVEALKVLVKTKFGRLPVLDQDGKLVGVITKGDITNGLLDALQRDYEEEELIRYRASHLFEDIISDRTSLILRYKIKPRDFNHGGTASSNIKRALLRLGANPQIARRCGIAVYEVEMNLIIHTTNGGTIRMEIEPNKIAIEAYDDGPGIKDIHLAMQPGFSTASEDVREKGFGAGMGLTNIQRCVDELKIESTAERGTNIRMKIILAEKETIGESPPNP
jgi:CBS domain-containing protein/anti-sigma regulatory factor (Ser/Thr protein kinase)